MNVFVINAGSSSLKYQLIRMPEAVVVCTGLVDRIGQQSSTIAHKAFLPSGERIHTQSMPIADHRAGLEEVRKLLLNSEIGVIADPDEVHVVGHRVVHGGEKFSATQLIEQETLDKIRELFPLAPLHNPSNYMGIEVATSIFSKAKQVGVFDTAFHQTLPPVAYRFAIPNEFYENHGIRAYGFHGTSHQYVSSRALDYLQKQDSKLISIHLGNGCSMAAIRNGVCIDTSMGLGPMNGLVMGTRAGDLDQSVIFHLVSQLGYSLDEVNHILNKKSGMLGLTGFSDMRDIQKKYYEGDPQARLGYELYAYRIQKYIGAFAAVLNGLDAVIFTAGVGENDALTRKLVCKNLDFLGIELDEQKNEMRANELRELQSADSRVKILVVPTNEELEIAIQCFELLKK
jgi:acetate kinase